MEALQKANTGHALAYGNDRFTHDAEVAFSELFGKDVVSRFAFGGTGANVMALAWRPAAGLQAITLKLGPGWLPLLLAK